MPTRRRTLLAGFAAAAPPMEAMARPGFDDWDGFARAMLAPIRAAAAMADGPALLKSWLTRGPPGGFGSPDLATDADFDRVHAEAAYTYDNALAGLALLAAGERALARRLAEGLRLAQAQDRHWRDGRLRNAYAAGRQHAEAPRSARPPGWWDARAGRWLEDGYHAGSATGPVAFAILLWTALGDPPFLAAAARAADWVEAALRAPADDHWGGYFGGFLGHEPEPRLQRWRSTEQNLDLAVAFGRLGRREAAAHATRFVRRMWLVAERRFLAGLTPEGEPNAHSALDANLWPLLAWPLETRFHPAVDWVLQRHGLPAGAPRAEVEGLDFDSDRDGVWLEGTAQAVLLLRRMGEPLLAEQLARTVARHRGTGGWVLAASVPLLTTGLATGLVPGAADLRYPRRGHLAANAWAALAGLGVSPFDAPAEG